MESVLSRTNAQVALATAAKFLGPTGVSSDAVMGIAEKFLYWLEEKDEEEDDVGPH